VENILLSVTMQLLLLKQATPELPKEVSYPHVHTYCLSLLLSYNQMHIPTSKQTIHATEHTNNEAESKKGCILSLQVVNALRALSVRLFTGSFVLYKRSLYALAHVSRIVFSADADVPESEIN
jgi:hypothetical protein